MFSSFAQGARLTTLDLSNKIARGLASLALSALLNSLEFLLSEFSANKSWQRMMSLNLRDIKAAIIITSADLVDISIIREIGTFVSLFVVTFK